MPEVIKSTLGGPWIVLKNYKINQDYNRNIRKSFNLIRFFYTLYDSKNPLRNE